MAREELARLLSCLLERGQSARCCDDLAEFESRLFAELLHWKNSFRWFRFLLLRGTAESGALKANALPGGARRLAVRAVKAAWFSRSSERSGRALTGGADGTGAAFQEEGQNKRLPFLEIRFYIGCAQAIYCLAQLQGEADSGGETSTAAQQNRQNEPLYHPKRAGRCA